MRSIIEDFFNGEHIPSDRGPKMHLAEYQAECRAAGKAEDALCACLGEEQKELFETYKLHEQKSGYMEIIDNFVHGFCLGMLMAREVYEVAGE